MRRYISLSILVTLLLGSAAVQAPASAETVDPGSAPAQNDSVKTPAAKFVQDLGNRAMGVIANNDLSQSQRSQKYGDLLRTSFDMPTIGHFVIGRNWNAATPQQQQEYMKLFQALVVKSYGERLNFYSGEKFNVKGSRAEDDKDTIVNSEITHPDGSKPTDIDWRVRQANGRIAVVDVMVAGVSQSVTQRQEYTAIIQRDGGKIDGLLDLMRKRLQEPSTQTSNNDNE